jgi:N-acetylglutamate synthase-like GNAT family acetyltransferase/DNA-binding MarR family transcriptional regulator
MTDSIAKLGYLAGATRFRRISEKLYVDGDKIYKDSGIDFKASWFSVFYILATSNQPKTVLDLSDEIGFTHITSKNVLRELETNGLVNITIHPTDKRSKHITLSEKGLQLLEELKKIWLPFADTLKHLLDTGHPDFLNIINRIDKEVSKHPIHEKIKMLDQLQTVQVLDYKPSLKKYFYELAGNWLLGVLKGTLEEEDKFTLHHPDKAYLETGGFVFFALHNNKVVGCVALKRLDETTFEFAKLFIDPNARNLGIATKLIERCISRCRENEATQLWLQTTMSMPQAHKLYYKLGFDDKQAPPQMTVLKRTEKIMCLEL